MQEAKVGVLGAGAWGTAMASVLAKGGHDVEIWAMEEEVCRDINTFHENKRFLPGIKLAETLRAESEIEKVADGKEFLFVASPSIYIESTLKKIAHLPCIQSGETVLAALTKGFVPSVEGNGALPLLVHEAMERALPDSYKEGTVYVSGPSHAEEVASGKLTGLIAASLKPKNSIRVRNVLSVPHLMVFSSFDIVGVEISAAAKNVVAVMYGALDAITHEGSEIFGDNTSSLLLAAGLNEIQTLGVSMGATHAETFTSIAGIGDLDVTCKSVYGRNRRFGQDMILKGILSSFSGIEDLIKNISTLAYLPEGVVACKYVHEIAEKNKLKLPICEGLYRILNKEISVRDFLDELLIKGTIK